ncbi:MULTISPECIES: transglycosylase SLT domain-containing protein [Streptomyces]|uniref:Transglycosylase SLT domain-containing protein n=1 Tax=Streptomyces lycii TaxID=2654337 RepID=A0ABQ7FEM4_9ACTN|nr:MULTISPECIES: transglycosylase SLT domain-containing protein [Streptomyces]KAF4406983.1 transglycosylase SLT domain-containing protein [Streptomyces lycii]PGH51065.1 lytic transglycosylase [Streptomyces sp. Ru87]
MRVPTFSGNSSRLTKPHKFSAAGLAAVGAASLVFAAAPGPSEEPQSTHALPAAYSAEVTGQQGDQKTDGLFAQQKADDKTVQALSPLKETKAPAAGKSEAKTEVKADTKADTKADAGKAETKAESERSGDAAANRSAERGETKSESAPATYPDNLDGWIREAMSIMKEKGIPGSYEGIHRNIIRESGGDPYAINNWDINAQNGIPSKGLLQVIQPTFDAYHVEGTEHDLYDPVANIVAACNYAADRYGSMDNVDSAY